MKRLRSLQKTEMYLEPKQASTMELFFVNILIELLFYNKSSIYVWLYAGLRKY